MNRVQFFKTNLGNIQKQKTRELLSALVMIDLNLFINWCL